MIAAPSGQTVVWLAAGSGCLAATSMLLSHSATAVPTSALARNSSGVAGTAELASMGFGPRRIGGLTAAATLLVAGAAALHALGRRPPASPAALDAQTIAEMTAWVLLVVLWLPTVLSRLLRAAAGTRYLRRRDAAVLLWVRRIRLLVAAGRPTNAAVLDAAERVDDRAFGPTAGAINLAVATGRDPLAAAATRLRGSDAAALLGTVDTAERSGAGASELLDRVLQRVLRTLDAQRRERIDRLGRAATTTASLNTILAGGVVVLMVVATLPST